MIEKIEHYTISVFLAVTIIVMSIILMCLLPIDGAYAEEIDTIYVRDYGALPDDGIDDSAGINSAIDRAIETHASRVVLDGGTYDFGLADNALNGAKEHAYIRVIGASDLTIEGATNASGEPITLLLRHNPGGNNAPLTQQIYTRDCTRLVVKNLVCDTTPYYYSAGKVESIKRDTIVIDICDGHPTPTDWGGDMYMNMAGLYSISQSEFFRHQIAWTEEDSSNAIPVKDLGGGKIEVNSKYLAEQLRDAFKYADKDDLILYWFQGHINPCYRLIDNSCDEALTYENIRIANSSAFAVYTEYTHGVHYNGVKIEPPADRYAVGARDVMKLFCCSGDIITENTTMNGFEDDGQNCHGMLAVLSEVTDSHTIVMTGVCVDDRHPERFRDTNIRLLNPTDNGVLMNITVESATKVDEGKYSFKIVEDISSLRDMATGDFRTAALGELGAYLPDSWTVRGCHITNTFRGLKVSTDNVIIENSVFDNNVYNIYIGAENDEWWHESCHPRHIIIRNNTFKHPLYGTCIDMDFHSYADMTDAPVMNDIEIYGNRFESADIGIIVRDARDVYIYDNVFEGVTQPICIEPMSVSNVHYTSKADADGRVGEEVALRESLRAQEEAKNIETLSIVSGVLGAALIATAVILVVKNKKRKAQ